MKISKQEQFAYLVFFIIGILVSVCIFGCKKKEDPADQLHDATLTFYSQHSPFVIKYTDNNDWHTDTITGNTHTRNIKVAEYDFNKSQQIKSVASYPVDSLYIRADIDGKKAEFGFKGLYMKIEIDVSLSEAK